MRISISGTKQASIKPRFWNVYNLYDEKTRSVVGKGRVIVSLPVFEVVVLWIYGEAAA